MVKINKNAKPAKSLPNGWMVLTKYRKRGSSKGHRDLTYYSPDMQRFRSLVAAKRFIAANTAPEADEKEESEEIEDNLIVQQNNDVVNDAAETTAASSSQALADSSSSNVVYVVDSSSSDDDDDSLWM